MKKQINFIAFLGPDGGGKSTIIELLKKDKELPFSRIDYFHLKPRLFGNKGDGKPVKNPHGKTPHKGIKSYLKLLYFALDYIIGYWLKIYPLKIKSSLIIFDRYYDDILVDPKRYRYGGSLKIAKLMRFFIPKPDIYIILTANPEVIYKRKQEVDFEELKRQLTEYEKLVDNQKYFKIDANLTPKEIVNEIKKIIIVNLAKKYEQN
jgi:thymidylate kinase